MSLGHNIRHHRTMQGLTLEQLSERSGVDVGTISALENRDSSRSKYGLAIAKGLGVSFEILSETIPPSQETPETEEITLSGPAPAPDGEEFPRLADVELRLVTRPPMTQDEKDILDGYRMAGEEVRQRIFEMCSAVLRRADRREGERQKKA